MTNTNASPPPAAPETPRRGFRPIYFIGRVGRGLNLNSKEHHQRMLFLGSWDALFYMLATAIVVPLMGTQGVHMEYGVKLIIAMVWFALTPLYWYIEVSEITAQIALHGLLNTDRTEHQRKTMMLPYWGVTFAIVLWIVAKASGGFYIEINYGWIEWLILFHTFLNALLSINVLYPLVSNYLQATSAQRRFETDTSH